jgi:mono/diheme cytochrome c family protein
MKSLIAKSRDVEKQLLILIGKTAARCIAAIFLFSLVAYTPAANAQQLIPSNSLNETQKLGRRIFQQRCGVCHTPPTITSGIYGPILYKDVVAGNEVAIKKFIQDGSTRMPGFRYGLEPTEIDSIIEYLKTVPKPQKRGSPASRKQGPID